MTPKKVMVVDDDVDFLKELEETLALSGYEIVAVQNSKNAGNAAAISKPDIILLDLKMEGMDGFEVAQTLKRSPETNSIPLIAMTGYFTSEEHNEIIKECGMKTCLKKPFNPLDLIARIESVLSDGRDKA
ncbi:MAG: response regulator [Candidatus Omnitrophica bacterium]|nr:response regulator [Candidatus Omnitrophota bacterium]